MALEISTYEPTGKQIKVSARDGEEHIIVDSPSPGVCYLHVYPKPEPLDRFAGKANYVKLGSVEREELIEALTKVAQ